MATAAPQTPTRDKRVVPSEGGQKRQNDGFEALQPRHQHSSAQQLNGRQLSFEGIAVTLYCSRSKTSATLQLPIPRTTASPPAFCVPCGTAQPFAIARASSQSGASPHVLGGIFAFLFTRATPRQTLSPAVTVSRSDHSVVSSVRSYLLPRVLCILPWAFNLVVQLGAVPGSLSVPLQHPHHPDKDPADFFLQRRTALNRIPTLHLPLLLTRRTPSDHPDHPDHLVPLP
jgi:hypothetical protein